MNSLASFQPLSFPFLYIFFLPLPSWESAPVNSVGPEDHERDNNMALSQILVLLEINTQPTSVPDKEAGLTQFFLSADRSRNQAVIHYFSIIHCLPFHLVFNDLHPPIH